MMNETEAQKEAESQKKLSLSDDEEKSIEKKIPMEEDIDKNPDIEDPRLYSPLQEPDRPSPSERTTDEETEETESGNTQD